MAGRISVGSGRPITKPTGTWKPTKARAGAVMQPGVYPYDFAQVPAAPSLPFGAAGGVPGSLGVVDGDGQIPYIPDALVRKQDNATHWLDRDPELKCQLPGVPRAMYMPYPYQIVQSTDKIHIFFAFSNAARVIHLDDVAPSPVPQSMGHSVGRWEGRHVGCRGRGFQRSDVV